VLGGFASRVLGVCSSVPDAALPKCFEILQRAACPSAFRVLLHVEAVAEHVERLFNAEHLGAMPSYRDVI